jgi:hypothetical protein
LGYKWDVIVLAAEKLTEETLRSYQSEMVVGTSSATEETGSTPLSSAAAAAGDAKETPRSFLSVARRNLTDEELSAPAARRFLIAEIERLDQLCMDHEPIISSFHEQRVTIAELRAAAHPARWVEILSSICLIVGSAGLGAAPSYFAIPNAQPVGLVVVCLSAILVVGGIAPKVWR